MLFYTKVLNLFHDSEILHASGTSSRSLRGVVAASASHTHACGTQLVQAARAVAVAAHCSTHKAAASYTPGFAVQNRTFLVQLSPLHACLRI